VVNQQAAIVVLVCGCSENGADTQFDRGHRAGPLEYVQPSGGQSRMKFFIVKA
jgi:hypothetical protein